MIFKLQEKKVETPSVTTFIFKPNEPITWQAGQFFHYVLHHEPTDDRGSDRWFTISAAPFEEMPSITTRQSTDKSSSFKKELFSLKEGDEIEISDLDGDFTVEDPEKRYIFIAGGIGVTPFRSIIKQLDHDKKPINITLLYANRDQNVVFKEELEEIAQRNPSLKINYIFSPDRIDENKIKQLGPNLAEPIFYISGPEPMVDSLGETLKTMGIAEDHIKQDWFPNYLADLS